MLLSRCASVICLMVIHSVIGSYLWSPGSLMNGVCSAHWQSVVFIDTLWTCWLIERTTTTESWILHDRCLLPLWLLPQGKTTKRGKQRANSYFAGEGHLVVSSHALFYLGRRMAPTWPKWGCDYYGLAEKSWPQINSAIYGPTRLTAAPERGNIAHLAGLLGAVMPQRPALWQAINVPRER